MKVTVIAFSEAESYRAEEGLTKLTRGVNRFKRDLRDRRVDQSTVESFVRGLRAMANYFDEYLKDETVTEEVTPEENNQV